MAPLESFCLSVKIDSVKRNVDQAALLIYYHCKVTGETEVTMQQIMNLFESARLAEPNWARLKRDFKTARSINKGKSPNSFRVSRSFEKQFDEKYASLFDVPAEVTVEERVDLSKAPLLTTDDVEGARKMAKLYVITHCYENSVRKVILKVLTAKLGMNWWDQAGSTSMKQKVRDRRAKEQTSKWMTARGQSELYYIDWGDLLYLIRKYEADFKPLIPDYKFVELRFEELERFRNVVAHHGVLQSDDEIDHIVLSFKQWCKQLS